MKVIDPGDLAPRALHELLTGTVVPRPIALVSTVSAEGVGNLAPFSFFNGVSSRPPLISLSIARRRDGEKDTMRNVRATKEFVVNVVDRAILGAAVTTSGDHPAAVDEFTVSGLTPLASDKVAPPRVAESPVHLECVLVDLFDQPGGAPVSLVIGRVLRFHVARRVWRDGAVDPEALDPAARLGGTLYAGLGELVSLDRPSAERG